MDEVVDVLSSERLSVEEAEVAQDGGQHYEQGDYGHHGGVLEFEDVSLVQLLELVILKPVLVQ